MSSRYVGWGRWRWCGGPGGLGAWSLAGGRKAASSPGGRGGRGLSGSGPALEYQSGVGATEAEAVGHDQIHCLIQALAQDRQAGGVLVQLLREQIGRAHV